MNTFDKIINKERKTNIHGKTIDNYILIEWIKWLSYEPNFEKKRIEYFDSKKISDLSYEELEEASKYSKNKVFARLIRKYINNECQNEDIIKIYNYFRNESLEKLMLSKLTKEELQYAKEKIIALKNNNPEQLSAKIKEQQQPEIYQKLSMVDSYILHVISNINDPKRKSNLNKKILK